MKNPISLIPLSSVLNGQDQALVQEMEAFLSKIDPRGDFTFLSEGEGGVPLFYVQTGGSEPGFAARYQNYQEPYYFLVTGTRNSLAASLEMLSFLQQRGLRGKIIMGTPEKIHDEICEYLRFSNARAELRGSKMGVIGAPSDWLIASHVDKHVVQAKLGIEILPIDYQEFMDEIEAVKEVPEALIHRFKDKTNRQEDLIESLKIYLALKALCSRHGLSGFTLRCFDLLNLKHQTSCLAFGLLNEEGIIAGCEGDIPAMLTMAVAKALFGYAPFMANPSRFDMETNTAVYAHCTLPLNFVKSYTLDTHFESGLGFGIKGEIEEGPCTCFKISPDMTALKCLEGNIVANHNYATFCRTQIEVKFSSSLNEITDHPFGNHMIFAFGHHKEALARFFAFLG
ncbi:MAG: hypothetical protein IJU64_03950 [Bacilli bacterium]|nr:hypothetical protein [Bacilli bacterium]